MTRIPILLILVFSFLGVFTVAKAQGEDEAVPIPKALPALTTPLVTRFRSVYLELGKWRQDLLAYQVAQFSRNRNEGPSGSFLEGQDALSWFAKPPNLFDDVRRMFRGERNLFSWRR